MLDPEHLLGVLLMVAPMETPTYLAGEADVIAEVAAGEDEAAGLMVLVAVVSAAPWGARRDSGCARVLNAQACAPVFVARWREAAAVCGRNVERRFAYWNTGSCDGVGAVTRRQMRVWRMARREL